VITLYLNTTTYRVRSAVQQLPWLLTPHVQLDGTLIDDVAELHDTRVLDVIVGVRDIELHTIRQVTCHHQPMTKRRALKDIDRS